MLDPGSIGSAVVGVLVLWTVSLAIAAASQCPLVPLEGGFVLHGRKLIFDQPDGSLTALDIETGAVLTRLMDRDYGGRPSAVPEGILIAPQRDPLLQRFLLLDPETFELARPPVRASQAQYVSGLVVYRDPAGRVVCEELRNGKRCWSYNLPELSQLSVNDRAVLLCSIKGGGQLTTVVKDLAILDLKSGAEMVRMSPRRPGRCVAAYLWEDRLLLVKAAWRSTTGSGPPVILKSIVEFDLRGKLLCEHEAPAGGGRRPFPFLWRGLVFPAAPHMGPYPEEHCVPLPEEEFVMGWLIHDARGYKLDSGWVRSLMLRGSQAPPFSDLAPGGRPHARTLTLVEARVGDAHWWGAFPEGLGKWIALERVALFGDRLILGSAYGQVQCVDAKMGRNEWLYVFPTIERGTPTMDLPWYEEEDAFAGRLLGMIGLPEGFSPENEGSAEIVQAALQGAKKADPLIEDPQPASYSWSPALRRWIVFVSVTAAIGVVGVATPLVIALWKRRKARA